MVENREINSREKKNFQRNWDIRIDTVRPTSILNEMIRDTFLHKMLSFYHLFTQSLQVTVQCNQFKSLEKSKYTF